MKTPFCLVYLTWQGGGEGREAVLGYSHIFPDSYIKYQVHEQK